MITLVRVIHLTSPRYWEKGDEGTCASCVHPLCPIFRKVEWYMYVPLSVSRRVIDGNNSESCTYNINYHYHLRWDKGDEVSCACVHNLCQGRSCTTKAKTPLIAFLVRVKYVPCKQWYHLVLDLCYANANANMCIYNPTWNEED